MLRFSLYLLVMVLSFGIGYAAYDGYKLVIFLRASTGQKISHSLTTAPTLTAPSSTTSATVSSTSASTVSQPSADLAGSMNILLLGSDNDQKFDGRLPLTQTMMVVHIDPTKKEVDMFSIPRDLWVQLPSGKAVGKIDQAAMYGGLPDAIKVVEQNFGIHIDHYAWVGLYGFIKGIDTVGGINLDVLHPLLDNTYPADINSANPYAYQRLYQSAGLQHLNGETALQYVRSRHQEIIGDFGRTQKQRQLLLALKSELLSKSLLLQGPSLFDNLQDQFKTDLDAFSALQIGYFYLTHQPLIEKQFTLTPPIYSRLGMATDGQDIVVGDANATAKLVEDIFGPAAGAATLKSLSHLQGVVP